MTIFEDTQNGIWLDADGNELPDAETENEQPMTEWQDRMINGDCWGEY